MEEICEFVFMKECEYVLDFFVDVLEVIILLVCVEGVLIEDVECFCK